MANDMSSNFTNEIPYTIGLILVFCITGTIGNSLVIFVYSQKNDKQTATLFILILAIADIVSCLINMPLTIVFEMFNFLIPNEFLCRFYFVINCFSTLFSTLLMSAIALDRYLCICHPFARIMTVFRAKVLVGLLATFSMTLGLFSLLATGVEELEIGNTTVLECVDKAFLTNFSMTPEQKVLITVGQNAHMISYIFCVICVVVLYVLIYLSVLRMRQKRRRLKGARLQLVNNGSIMQPVKTECVTATTRNLKNTPDDCEQQQAVDVTPTAADEDKPLRPTSSTHGAPESTVRTVRDNQALQNLKTAAMLFIVAYVYILGFAPAILMSRKVIEIKLYIFYLYYVNNAANPVIYSFMNQNFRQDIRRLCLNYRIGRDHNHQSLRRNLR